MIDSINLKNYKAFKDSGDITLAPITLISGQNSSGKSSIIQSLLIFKQTIESSLTEESLQLNGNYIALGEFADIINDKNSDIEFKFRFTETDSKTQNFSSDTSFFVVQNDVSMVEMHLKYVVSNFQSHNEVIHPKLANVSFRIEADEEINSLEIDCNEYIKSILKENYILPTEDLERKNIDIIGTYDLLSENKEKAFSFEGFLPSEVLIAVNRGVQKVQSEVIDYIFETIFPDSIIKFKNNKIPSHIKYRNTAALKKNFVNIEDNPLITQELYEDLNQKLSHFLKEMSEKSILSNTIDDLEFFLKKISYSAFEKINLHINYKLEVLKDERKKLSNLTLHPLFSVGSDSGLENLASAVNLIKENFDNIYYLGPLREQPRTFYGNFTTQNNMYVGTKGEYVSFVLRYYSTKKIKTILPPLNDSILNVQEHQIEEVTLEIALQRWLSYLGIAQKIEVEKIGKVGLTIRANIHGKSSSDLTNVGVGVSQILPLIVLGLVSPTNSLLLFEQPELHLHPYVQSRLADFFVALSLTGKQIIAETHSEHLINRMRLFIAKDDLKYEDDILVYFCQRNNINNTSEIIKVEFDKYGSPDSYPSGFFDETEKQLQEILMAALTREN